MTITPYSVTESTKISEAYVKTINEASAKWGAQVVDDVSNTSSTPTDDTTNQALRDMKEIDDISTPRVLYNPKQTYISAAPPKRKQTFLHAPRKNSDHVTDRTKQGIADGLSLYGGGVLGMASKVGKVAKAANAAKRVAGTLARDGYRGVKGLYRGGREVWNRTPGLAKGIGGACATIGGGYAAGDALTGGGLSSAVRYVADKPSKEDTENYNKVSQKNVDITRENNEQLNSEALMELEKGIGYGDGTAADTNHVGQILYSLNLNNPDDSRLAPYTNLKNVLRQFKHSDDNAADIQESKAAEHIKKAEEILARRSPIPKMSSAPTSDSAMRKATAIMAKGSAESQFPNTKLDPSDKSMMANLKDFAFSNPYITAGVITIPLITYIISKYGASLVNAIKGDGNDNKISGKEFVIVDNGKYLHSNGFTKTISKDIAIFKNNKDAKSAITALNAVKPSNYKIEELEKVIG